MLIHGCLYSCIPIYKHALAEVHQLRQLVITFYYVKYVYQSLFFNIDSRNNIITHSCETFNIYEPCFSPGNLLFVTHHL